MKLYQFPHNGIFLPVSDGDIFIFSFTMNAQSVCLDLLAEDGNSTYCAHILAGTIRVKSELVGRTPKVPQGVNVVIRVDKTSNHFWTYLNGDLFAITTAYNGHRVAKVVVFNAVLTDLAIFDSEDHEMARYWAEAMLNPGASAVEIQKEMMNDKRWAIDGSENAATDRETALEMREKAVGGREKEAAVREKEAVDREKEAADREKEAMDREKKVAGREKMAAEYEKTLEVRETVLEHHEKHMNNRSGDGGGAKDEDRLSLGDEVSPSDADAMRLSATVAWPRAIKQILGTSPAKDLQKRHDALMSDWVIARGDNISSNAYDYFVYSHGVAWPKEILENTTDANLAKIREKHTEIIKVLA